MKIITIFATENRPRVCAGCRISSVVEHFTRNEGVPSSSLGFGSKVQGRKTRDVKEKPPQSNLQAVFSWRIEARAARRTFESAPAASSREKTSEAKSSLGFGSGRGGCTDGATSFLCPAGLEEGFEGSGKGLKRDWKGSGEGLEGARTGTGRGLDGDWTGTGRQLEKGREGPRRAEKTREKFGEGPAKGQRRAGGEAGKWSEKELKRGREFILRQEANAPEASRRPATPQHTSAGRTTDSDLDVACTIQSLSPEQRIPYTRNTEAISHEEFEETGTCKRVK